MIHAWRTTLWGFLFFEAGALATLIVNIGAVWIVAFMGVALLMLVTRNIVLAASALALPLAGYVGFWALCSGHSC